MPCSVALLRSARRCLTAVPASLFGRVSLICFLILLPPHRPPLPPSPPPLPAQSAAYYEAKKKLRALRAKAEAQVDGQ